MQGRVIWFNNVKGFGFLKPDGGGEDIFVHYSCIAQDGYKQLRENQKVQFNIAMGPKGPQAEDVTVIEG